MGYQGCKFDRLKLKIIGCRAYVLYKDIRGVAAKKYAPSESSDIVCRI